jgi:hypothetical protein
MTEIVSHDVPAPENSISTDSEESFLMKQLNRSQLFNNTSSSSGSSNKQRRSFFRESYIDDDGALKSFSVYQDVINESTDASREISLSGLSTFNMDHVSNQNILNDVDPNQQQQRENNRKSVISRSSGSLKEQHLRRSHSKNSQNGSALRLTQQNSSSEGSQYPDPNSPESLYPVSKSLQANPAPVVPSPGLPLTTRIPTPEYPAPPPPATNSKGTPVNRSILQNDLTLEQIRGLKDWYNGQRSGSNSLRSGNSNTRESILSYEETRRKQRGTPHILVHNVEKVTIHKVTKEQFLKSERAVSVIPSIHSPTSPLSDDMGFRDAARSKKVMEKPFHLKEIKLRPAHLSDSESDIESKGSVHHLLSMKDMDPIGPADALMEKIQDSRTHNSNSQTPSSSIFWLIYALGFIMPALFFFLGFGLLDQSSGKIDHTLRRLSLATGVVWVLMALAMIGVGFGVGVTQARP